MPGFLFYAFPPSFRDRVDFSSQGENKRALMMAGNEGLPCLSVMSLSRAPRNAFMVIILSSGATMGRHLH